MAVDTGDHDPATLPDGEVAHVGLGAPGNCEAAPQIARTVTVTIAALPATTLEHAWLPVNCGHPGIAEVYVDATDPATQAATLAATLEAPAALNAGSTLRFTVTLTNTSTSEPVTFADCPAYSVGLKTSRVNQTYQLNCDVSPDLAPGKSRTYAIELFVPRDSARGDDLLTWDLRGYPASGTAPLQVN